METLQKRIWRYMESHKMLEEGDVLCVGVSGGADSVCLLRHLAELRRETPMTFSLLACHVHHGLRPAADEDARFVQELCASLEVPFVFYREAVAQKAEAEGIGLEEAGRLVRQEAYCRCAREQGATKIALAHQANDRAETFLFHVARGTSLGGLASIRPLQFLTTPDETNIVPVIRPLLFLSRAEIEEDLRSSGQNWREDESNLEDSFTRNAIRHHVLPYLEKTVNAQSVQHIVQAAEDLEVADGYLRGEAERRAAACGLDLTTPAIKKGEGILLPDALQTEDPLLFGYILRRTVELLVGTQRDWGRTQIKQVRALFSLQVGRSMVLPHRIRAVREYRGIRLVRRKDDAVTEEENVGVPLPEEKELLDGCERTFHGQKLSCRLFFAKTNTAEPIPVGQYTKWFDYDKIKPNAVFRFRRPGDHLTVDAEGHRQKLQDFLTNSKVPQAERNTTALLASGQEVYWVIGYRTGERTRITPETTRILEIRTEPDTGRKDVSCENR